MCSTVAAAAGSRSVKRLGAREVSTGAGGRRVAGPRGAVRPAVNHVYPLSEAAEAHRALEARETTGATVLLPWA